MKKITLLTFLMITLSVTAQGNQKEVDVSIKIHSLIDQIKKNDFFSFIGDPPKKMFEIYDCNNNNVDSYSVKGSDYTMDFNGNNVIVTYQGNKFYLTIVNKEFVGHGSTLDTRAKRMITYYFENDKIIKKSVITYSN